MSACSVQKCILWAIKNWRWGRPGNEARFSQWITWHLRVAACSSSFWQFLYNETLCYITGSDFIGTFSTFEQQEVAAVPGYLQGEITQVWIMTLCKETLCYNAGSELDELFSTFQQQQVAAVPDYLQGEIILQSDWSIAGSISLIPLETEMAVYDHEALQSGFSYSLCTLGRCR